MLETSDVLAPPQAHAVLAAAQDPEETAFVELLLRAGLRGREVLDLAVPEPPVDGALTLIAPSFRRYERTIAIAPTTARAVHAQAQAAGVRPGEPLFPGCGEIRLVQRVHGLCADADLHTDLAALRRTAISSALDDEATLLSDAQAYFGFTVDGMLPSLRPGVDVLIAGVLEQAYHS
ncbi:hypothetical protein ABZ883_40530 [Streptomyces sp. NPDC046977]|uniref:hypothetical protein n=1 Tax=Streptomyces sp. NPDC046977 TaxID=3154703 RepID=UPI00340F6C3E